MVDSPKKGDIYSFSIDSCPLEIEPSALFGLVISNQLANSINDYLIVAPISLHAEKIYPFESKVRLGEKRAKALLQQLFTLDKRRLGEKIGSLEPQELEDVDQALKISLSID